MMHIKKYPVATDTLFLIIKRFQKLAAKDPSVRGLKYSVQLLFTNEIGALDKVPHHHLLHGQCKGQYVEVDIIFLANR